ncbi:hypothetical protein N9937_00510 [bacterium]|nr:hypothetical protein [bacterium]
MADYTTEERVRRTLGDTGSASIQSDIVVEAIANATDTIKLTIGTAMTELIDEQQTTDGGTADNTNRPIRMLCSMLAAHLAYLAVHGRSADQDDSFSQDWEQRSLEMLDRIAETGQIPGISRSLLPESNTQSYHPATGVDNERNWDYDKDRQDATTDERDDS